MKTAKIFLLLVATALPGLSLFAGNSVATPAQAAGTVAPFDLSQLDTKPKPTKTVQPLYPAELKAARVTGDVVLAFVVDADGAVKNLRVEKATEPAFAEAALAAVAAWEFEPGTKDGKPVSCQLTLPLRFTLSN